MIYHIELFNCCKNYNSFQKKDFFQFYSINVKNIYVFEMFKYLIHLYNYFEIVVNTEGLIN